MFVEPFAGGGIVALTVAVERLADAVLMAELDCDVASVWRVAVDGDDVEFEWLCQRILCFKMSRDHVLAVLQGAPKTVPERAFWTILKNRVNRGGILATGASLVKAGENGKGLASRWYPKTLADRLRAIRHLRDRLQFRQADAFSIIQDYADDDAAVFFIDPPYTAGGKNAGSRLYTHNRIDHQRLFGMLAEVRGAFLATYDDAAEVHALARDHGFRVARTPMKSTHHAIVEELLITKSRPQPRPLQS